jgi:hypothetical protein
MTEPASLMIGAACVSIALVAATLATILARGKPLALVLLFACSLLCFGLEEILVDGIRFDGDAGVWFGILGSLLLGAAPLVLLSLYAGPDSVGA